MSTTHPPNTPVAIGVGIDTSRYGHHVTFLTADLQPATSPLQIAETRDGYDRLRQTFEHLRSRYPAVIFHIRLDVAGQYATNLEAFLRQLPGEKVITLGEPTRNKRYRDVHFPKRKSDATESHCAARFAVLERPRPTPEVSAEVLALREVASRLEAQARQVTRHVNQLHNLLARTFPELAVVTRDITADWVLTLLSRYPTPAKLARARAASLHAVPRIPEEKARQVHAAARGSIAAFSGEAAEALVLGLVRQVQSCRDEKLRLEQLLVTAYRALPTSHQLETIPGIGPATAAVLTAKIVAIDRFAKPEHLVGYFGLFPVEASSGIDPAGHRRPGRRTRMCRRGNHLVRGYLYMAALAAIRHNPACRALYRRLRGRGVAAGVALGHVMRKLLHLVFAVWKSDRAFDPQHYPWEAEPAQERAAGRMQGSEPCGVSGHRGRIGRE